jgi:hypothetical protein
MSQNILDLDLPAVHDADHVAIATVQFVAYWDDTLDPMYGVVFYTPYSGGQVLGDSIQLRPGTNVYTLTGEFAVDDNPSGGGTVGFNSGVSPGWSTSWYGEFSEIHLQVILVKR